MFDFLVSLEGIAAQVAAVSLALCPLILLLIAAGRPLRKRFHVRWQYFAWLVIALRLSIPFNLPLPDAPVQLEAPDRAVFSYQTPDPSQAQIPAQPVKMAEVRLGETTVTPIRSEPAKLPTIEMHVTLAQAAACVWLAGMLLLLARHFVGYALFCRKLRRWGRPETDKRLLAQAEQLRRELGIRRRVRLVRLSEAESPMAAGLFRPIVILPTAEIEPDRTEIILCHELTHCRHLDSWYQLLLELSCALHWFNPLVWWMRREVANTLELACDEAVTRGRDAVFRRDYCEAILRTAHGRTYTSFSTALGGGKQGLKARFASILNPRMRRAGGAILAAVVILSALSTSLVACGSPLDVAQTNRELSIYVPYDFMNNSVQSLINEFQKTHPDVDVHIAEGYEPNGYDTSAGVQKIKSELMAGTGPDLLLLWGADFGELGKLMTSNAFCDLNPFLKEDGDYDPEEFNQNVLSAGQHRGQQLVMPLFYDIPYFFSVKELLDKCGIDLEKCGNYSDFMTEITRYIESTGKPLPVYPWQYSAQGYPELVGQMLDYKNRKLNFDTPEFKRATDFYKLVRERAWSDNDYYHTMTPAYNALTEKSLFSIVNYATCSNLGYNIGSLLAEGQTPVYFPMRCADGKLRASINFSVAVRSKSENRQNAYDFIKLMMGDTFQSGYTGIGGDCYPVRKANSLDCVSGLRFVMDGRENRVEEFGKTFIFSPLPEEFYTNWVCAADQVDEASFQSPLVDDYVLQFFGPYWDGTASYADCLKKLESQLSIYITE